MEYLQCIVVGRYPTFTVEKLLDYVAHFLLDLSDLTINMLDYAGVSHEMTKSRESFLLESM